MTTTDKLGVWETIAAPLPKEAIQWRQQGKPTARDGRCVARFVAYIDAQFVRERFDEAAPGEWDVSLEPLPNRVTFDGEEDAEPFAFLATVKVYGVSRTDVGQGKDYKTAATDAFKRAAVRYGVGAELYAMPPLFVQMDGDGKYAKPLEDPGTVYARKQGWKVPDAKPLTSYDSETAYAPTPSKGAAASGADDIGATAKPSDTPVCPKCSGPLWDNRVGKRNPRAPDWKCKDRSCDGCIWPPKPGEASRQRPPDDLEDFPGALEEIPF
jgi:hypothetical protein